MSCFNQSLFWTKVYVFMSFRADKPVPSEMALIMVSGAKLKIVTYVELQISGLILA